MSATQPILYIVVPCYNESEVLFDSAEKLKNYVHQLMEEKQIYEESRILFVNDGSKDDTWQKMQQLVERDKIFAAVKLSRNRGHQNALLAGLEVALKRADIMISIDADLQDDIYAIGQMVVKYQEGNDIVYGVRSSREKDTAFKRNTAQTFYKGMNAMGGELIYNHADFRLMSKRAVEALFEYSETNLFLRGIVPMIGYPTATVEYVRGERLAGESKYPLKKMISFALEGITSLSVKPIRYITYTGGIIFVVSMVMLIKAIIDKYTGNTVSGWASLMVSIWALGGLQLLGIGIIGEYISKTYLETKRRPRYFIEKVIGDNMEEK